MFKHLIRISFFFLFIFSLPAIAGEGAAERSIRDWDKALGEIEATLKRVDIPAVTLSEMRARLSGINASARKTLAGLTPELDALKQRLKKLGPKPKDKEEPEVVATTRKEQNKLLESQQSLVNGVELVVLRAVQLDGEASEIQRSHFLGGLFSRTRSAFNPFLWADAAVHLPDFLSRLRLLGSGWINEAVTKSATLSWFIMAVALMMAFLIAFYLRNFLMRKVLPAKIQEKADRARLVSVAAKRAAADILPFVSAIWLLYGTLHVVDLLNLRMDRVAFAAALAVTAIVVIRGIARSILSPHAPDWRLGAAPDTSARRLYGLIVLVAVVFAADVFLARLAPVLFLPLDMTVIQSVFTALLLAGLLAAILRTPLVPMQDTEKDNEGRAVFTWLRRMRGLLWLLVIAIIAASLIGYIALGRFLATQSVTTGLLIISFYVLHLLVDETLVTRLHPDRATGKFLQEMFAISGRAVERVGIAIASLFDIVLVLLGIPLVILQWGFQSEDIRAWFSAVFFGVEVGNIRISLVSVLIGLGVFLTGLLLTRVFQRWLDLRLLSRSRFDVGVRNSIRTGVGYSGVLLALLIAVSYAGVDFTDIAIVAGALSVGIGFGLQSIVNNFVSGLILLAERPFKAGDWVVAAGEEGYVKRINVRSTEIETFNRSSVTIPNSKLITEPVRNWTHRSKLGRIILSVGVSYDADPEKVRKILIACADAHEEVVKKPASYVLFRDFGDSALIFEIRAYLVDIDRSVRVSSDLRFAIFHELKQAGIEIPYPQRDIHIRSEN